MRRRMLIPLAAIVLLVGSLAGALSAGASYHDHDHDTGEHAFADPRFERTWERTDAPVKNGQAQRTWMWGDGPYTDGMMEPYAEAPGGTRLVQYFDKSRMEDNSWRTTDEPWDVTNGLLTRDMILGQIQVGDTDFVDHSDGPSTENVAGDPDGDTGPTYAAMAAVLDAEARAEGTIITETLEPDGVIRTDANLVVYGATAGEHVQVEGIDHTVASVFWEFMNSQGVIWDGDEYTTGYLFGEDNDIVQPFYAVGYPITEAYWSYVPVAGTAKWVLVQCFERRCLTYTPDNPEGWKVEAGNVGQHYYRWLQTHSETQLPEERLFVAHLSGDQEVPPVETDASGEAVFFLSDDGLTLHYSIFIENLVDVTMAHIHLGEAGTNGGVIAWLFPDDGPPAADPPATPATVDGTITASDLPEGTTLFELVEMMAAGDTYVNFHTVTYGGGEIRGQIMVAEELSFTATLTNDQEVVADPVNQPDTGASGSATLTYDVAAGTITCEIMVADIVDVTMAHIHLAPIGVNGGVIVWLFPSTGPPPADPPVTPDGELSCETVTEERLNISEAVADQIGGTSLEAFVYQMVTSNTYVNVHTVAFGAGEIRGQISMD